MEAYDWSLPLEGNRKRNLIREATLEVLRPIVTALLIIMGVFVPLFALEGVEGKMFKPMAQTVLLALAASLVLAIVLMPVLGYMFFSLNKPRSNQPHNHTPVILRYILKGYAPLLKFALLNPMKIIAPTVALTIVSVAMFFRMGGDFIPQLNEGDMVINFSRPVQASFDSVLTMQKKSEKIIAAFPEVKEVYSRFGTPQSATDPAGIFFSDTFVILEKDTSRWRKKKWQNNHQGASLQRNHRRNQRRRINRQPGSFANAADSNAVQRDARRFARRRNDADLWHRYRSTRRDDRSSSENS
jgi:cobalt-zinc-cadmium resistance protein CzcA